jgi:DnaJ family protein A protein 2
LEYRKLGPGFVQQVVTGCNDCNGEGKILDPKFKCDNCQGKKVINESKTLEIYIDKGMKDGQKIVFENEADERPELAAGDIVFVLQQKPHEIYERDGIHLFMKKKINLLEALTGFQFKIKHLDGRTLLVTSDKTDVVKPNSRKQIDFEGMPTYKSPFDKGHLFITFDVEFPTTIPDDMVSDLIKILPQKEKVELNDGETEIELKEPVYENSKKKYYEDENQGRQQGISCQTQ